MLLWNYEIERSVVTANSPPCTFFLIKIPQWHPCLGGIRISFLVAAARMLKLFNFFWYKSRNAFYMTWLRDDQTHTCLFDRLSFFIKKLRKVFTVSRPAAANLSCGHSRNSRRGRIRRDFMKNAIFKISKKKSQRKEKLEKI